MTYVPKWATCERCKSFRPRSEMVRDRHRIRRWTCKSCPSEALDSGSASSDNSAIAVPSQDGHNLRDTGSNGEPQ